MCLATLWKRSALLGSFGILGPFGETLAPFKDISRNVLGPFGMLAPHGDMPGPFGDMPGPFGDMIIPFRDLLWGCSQPT